MHIMQMMPQCTIMLHSCHRSRLSQPWGFCLPKVEAELPGLQGLSDDIDARDSLRSAFAHLKLLKLAKAAASRQLAESAYRDSRKLLPMKSHKSHMPQEGHEVLQGRAFRGASWPHKEYTYHF